MNCVVCGLDMKEVLSVEDDGEKRLVLCQNHQLMIHAGLSDKLDFEYLPSQVNPQGSCDLCDKDKIYFSEMDDVFDVCKEHAHKMVTRNLSPSEFKVMYAKHPNAFILHDDFYDPESGEALQPFKR